MGKIFAMDATQKKSPEHLSATKQARRKETHPAQGGRERCTGDSARGGNSTHGSWTTEWSTMAEGLIGVQVDGARVPPGPRAEGQHDHQDQSQPGHGSVGFCRGVELGRASATQHLRWQVLPSQGCEDAVLDSLGKNGRPLAYRLVRDTDSLRRTGNGSAQ